MQPEAILNTPIGRLAIYCGQNNLFNIAFTQQKPFSPQTQLAEKICQQLTQYFQTRNTAFTVPLETKGTAFQQTVWQALQTIPLGKTKTYGELAKTLNTSPRAIGNACRANPVPIIIPCHRIVAANSLGGYAGGTKGKRLSIKKWLLNHENNYTPNV